MVKRKLSWYDNSIENERLAYGKGAAVVKKMNIPVGISDFEKIRKNGYYYGKTLGMSMLNSFFSMDKDSG